MNYSFGSLFAGIGGLDLGLEQAGLRCEWQVESNDYCQRVLRKHWPDVLRHDDVRTFPCKDFAYVDVIAAGFPCQDISNSGTKQGLTGSRSGLFWEAMRIVRNMEPRAVLLENVAALTVRGLPDVLGALAESGFDAWWYCLPASGIGAPHRRDRIFILAYSDSVDGGSRRTGRPVDGGSRRTGRPVDGGAWESITKGTLPIMADPNGNTGTGSRGTAQFQRILED